MAAQSPFALRPLALRRVRTSDRSNRDLTKQQPVRSAFGRRIPAHDRFIHLPAAAAASPAPRPRVCSSRSPSRPSAARPTRHEAILFSSACRFRWSRSVIGCFAWKARSRRSTSRWAPGDALPALRRAHMSFSTLGALATCSVFRACGKWGGETVRLECRTPGVGADDALRPPACGAAGSRWPDAALNRSASAGKAAHAAGDGWCLPDSLGLPPQHTKAGLLGLGVRTCA